MSRFRTRRLRAACREAPWLVAVGAVCAAIMGAIPALNHPWGSNWPMYFEAAHFFWDPTAAYFGWRPPLYPLLLATLGEPLGYVRAGHLIAQGSMLIVVAASGLFARLMAGVGVSVIAVLSIPLLQCAVEGAMWTNMYPPAAACFALAAAAAALVWRRPGLGTALLAGVLAGLAWRINHLGLVALPMGLGMCVLGAAAARNRGLWLGLPLLFSVGVGGAASADAWIVEHWGVPQESLGEQVLQRRREELERIASGQADPTRFSACTDPEPKPLNVSELTNECGQQFVSANYGTLRAEDCAPNLPTLMWLLPLVFLPRPMRPSWRDSAASILVFGGPIGAFLVAAAWTSYAEKYAISFLPMMTLLVPLALSRALGWAGRAIDRIAAGHFLGLLAAAGWVTTGWPGAQGPWADRPNINTDWESVAGEVAVWAKSEMNPGDALIDCVPLNIDLVLLPETFTTFEGVSTEHDCMNWVISPPAAQGRVWMVQQSFPEIPETQATHMIHYGWRMARQYDDRHRLWEYDP